nr:immunoglobulin light chain junction region [Macaca mulatta]
CYQYQSYSGYSF